MDVFLNMANKVGGEKTKEFNVFYCANVAGWRRGPA
jgi:hypothetical protein